MSTTIMNVRFVRCPKCLQLIPEFANIPVYRCGGCNTILRAKYYIASSENAASGMPEDNSNISTCIVSDGLISSTNQLITITSEMDNGAEHGAPPNSSTDSIAATNSVEKGETSDHCKHGIEVRASDHDSPSTDSPAFKIDSNLNEDAEKMLKLSLQDQDELRKSVATEESAELISYSVVPKEVVGDRLSSDLCTSSFGSTNKSSHAYDTTASSSTDQIHLKYLLPSKRTFRQKGALSTTDSKGKKIIEDEFPNDVVTTDSGLQLQLQNLGASATVGSSELSSRHGIGVIEKEMSLESEDFHSVQNWMELDMDSPSSSLSRNSINGEDTFNDTNDKPSAKFEYVEPDRMKILAKVDELRNELSKLFDQEKRSYLGGAREEDSTHCLGSDFVLSGPEAHLQRENTQERFRFPRTPFSVHHHCSGLHRHPVDHQFYPIQIASRLTTHGHKVQEYNHESKSLIKQKRQAIRRYCLPVSGGSPFIICYNCLTLLQLPADFLVSGKRVHKLQCGSCKEIQVYSFRDRPQRISQTPVELQHPPSEINSNLDASLGREMPTSHSNYHPQGDPVSFTDAFELTFGRRDYMVPEHMLNVTSNSSGIFQPQNGKQAKCLQLHQLLGYSSARELLFQDNVEGCQSTEPDTPHFHRPSGENCTRYRLAGPGIRAPHQEHSAVETSLDFPEIRGEDESSRKSRIKRGASPLRGLLKRIKELNHGL